MAKQGLGHSLPQLLADDPAEQVRCGERRPWLLVGHRRQGRGCGSWIPPALLAHSTLERGPRSGVGTRNAETCEDAR